MVKSYKGKEVNLDLLRENSAKTLAVGNMRTNGRGDLIGRAGKILKTREQLENEYVTNNPNAVKQRQEDSIGFNKGLAEYRDEILSVELAKEDSIRPTDPYKDSTKHNKNLSTSKKEKVKFTDLTQQAEETTLDDLPLEDEFEIAENPEPNK